MSGHWPTVLELAPPSIAQEAAVAGLLATLQGRYASTLRNPAGPGGASTLGRSGSISLGDANVWLELQAGDGSAGSASATLAIRLDSKAFEAACDVVRQRVHPRGLGLLIRLCVDVAAAAHADGFRLRFDNGAAGAPAAGDWVASLGSNRADPGLMIGIAEASAHWPTVGPYWSGWIAVQDYQVKEFVS